MNGSLWRVNRPDRPVVWLNVEANDRSHVLSDGIVCLVLRTESVDQAAYVIDDAGRTGFIRLGWLTKLERLDA